MNNRFLKTMLMHGIDGLSLNAVRRVVSETPGLEPMWDYSLRVLPDMHRHFTGADVNAEIERRIRLLLCFEACFTGCAISHYIDSGPCSYADVGDSDGTVQVLLRYFGWDVLQTTGINLQQTAVDRIRQLGFNAICADAMQLGRHGQCYDVVSVFETLEHLPDPIGFLKGMRSVVRKTLVISVPFIRKSRVGMAYLSPKWQADLSPTIENTHIFELSPTDWQKIFKHSGWRVSNQKMLMMFPKNSWLRLILQPYWRFRSFEGFWFVSLTQDDRFSERYRIE